MAWQETAALSLVAVTAGLFGWNAWRSRKGHGRSGCGCAGCGSPGARRPPSIIFRARKGEPPRAVIKL